MRPDLPFPPGRPERRPPGFAPLRLATFVVARFPVVPFLVALLVWATVLPTELAAQRALFVDRFSVTMEVGENGTVEVVETITYTFRGSWNGVFREIPVRYETSYGFDKRLHVEDVRVTDGDGEELWFENDRSGRYRRLKIRVPGATDATRTVRIAYTLPDGLLFFETHDELYWNVTGNESDVPVERADATVRLPEGVTGLRAAAYTGRYGERGDEVRREETESGFYFETTAPLGFREGLTVVVGWDPGVVARPTAWDRVTRFLGANWPLGLPVLSLLAMALVWHRRGRDPRRRPIAPRYQPPDGMTPSEVGTLVDNRPDVRDVTADLVDLAVKGYLRIEEVAEKESGLAGIFAQPDFRFVRLRAREAWKDLPHHQMLLLEGVFGYRDDEVLLSDLAQAFYEDLSDIRNFVFRKLEERGCYAARPDRVKAAWIAGGVALLVALPFAGAVLSGALDLSPVSAMLGGLLAAVPVLAFAPFMPARTTRGTRLLEEVLGFQEFLERVEADRFERTIDSPELFERYLPYAMALGVEKRWARAFEELGAPPPEWYVSGRGTAFRPTLFVDRLGTMTTRAGSDLTSRPRSSGGGSGWSGSSGFSSGGGFSGGGMGGGGTGGW